MLPFPYNSNYYELFFDCRLRNIQMKFLVVTLQNGNKLKEFNTFADSYACSISLLLCEVFSYYHLAFLYYFFGGEKSEVTELFVFFYRAVVKGNRIPNHKKPCIKHQETSWQEPGTNAAYN